MKKLISTAALATIVPLLGVTSGAEAVGSSYTPDYANCTAMHRDYPHGVGLRGAHDHTSGVPVTNFARRPNIYRANKKSDADGDHIACEAH